MSDVSLLLKAASDPTRARILALVAQSELAVSDLTRILAQSQPRVSRHVRILGEAGLIDRHREGAWLFIRLARTAPALTLAALIAEDSGELSRACAQDAGRLAQVRAERSASATRFFAAEAERDGALRALYGWDKAVEAALAEVVAERPYNSLLDIGVGAGRMIELFGRNISAAMGVDHTPEMLALARATLDGPDYAHVRLRLGDMATLPLAEERFDLVILHQVLHFSDRPEVALAEAARALNPGGRLLVIDFAAHQLDRLREEHAHVRLGFTDDQMQQWMSAAGLRILPTRRIKGPDLMVVIWQSFLESTGALLP